MPITRAMASTSHDKAERRSYRTTFTANAAGGLVKVERWDVSIAPRLAADLSGSG